MLNLTHKITVLSFVIAVSSQAETTLSCWNIFSPSGSRPIMKAEINEDNVLSRIRFDFSSPYFEGYSFDREEELVNWDNQIRHTTSKLIQPRNRPRPTENTSANSPYRGNNEYKIKFGKYTDTWPNIPELNDLSRSFFYGARIVLPKDLSNEFLRTYRIRVPEERSNAVMIHSPIPGTQQGSNYLRMFCKSE